MSRPAWGAWIEMLSWRSLASALASRPAWGAWIEIQKMKREGFTPAVAPRMGRVD